MRQNLCDSEFMLTSSDIKEIEEIEKEYHTDEFIYGKTLDIPSRIIKAGKCRGL